MHARRAETCSGYIGVSRLSCPHLMLTSCCDPLLLVLVLVPVVGMRDPATCMPPLRRLLVRGGAQAPAWSGSAALAADGSVDYVAAEQEAAAAQAGAKEHDGPERPQVLDEGSNAASTAMIQCWSLVSSACAIVLNPPCSGSIACS